jgi:hypothetical protein
MEEPAVAEGPKSCEQRAGQVLEFAKYILAVIKKRLSVSQNAIIGIQRKVTIPFSGGWGCIGKAESRKAETGNEAATTREPRNLEKKCFC